MRVNEKIFLSKPSIPTFIMSLILQKQGLIAFSRVLSFEQKSNFLVYLLHDNGKGFEPDKSNNGMGIRIMRERAFLCNGNLTIRSSSKGTIVKLVVPIYPNN